MSPRVIKHGHLLHPTDRRRTVGGHARAACGRWILFLSPAWHVVGKIMGHGDTRPVCPKCAVAQLIHDSAQPTPPAGSA